MLPPARQPSRVAEHRRTHRRTASAGLTSSGALSLTVETVIARCGGPLTAAVDDDLVMLDPERSMYFGLDRVGNRIWELLERPRSVGDLCSALEEEFDVTPETCRADVLVFVEQLSDAELVEIR